MSEQLHMPCMFNNHIFPFLILFIVVVIVFSDTLVFQCRHTKLDNLEMVNQFTRQKNSKITASTCRKVGVLSPLVANEFFDPLKSRALHNHFYFILSKQLLSPSRFRVRKTRKVCLKKGMWQTTVYLVGILGSVSCLLRVAITC